MLWVGVNALFADALVQRAEVDDAMAASAFWASVGGRRAVRHCAGRRGPADCRQPGRYTPGRRCPPCWRCRCRWSGAGGVVQGLLTRRRDYRVLAGRAIIGQGLGTAAGIAAALGGAGAWAPVLQQFVTSAAGALALLLRDRLAATRASGAGSRCASCCASALPLTASTLVLTARYRLFALLLGGTAGATALGETHMAFRLVDTVRELCSTALWRLMLPVLAEHPA